VNTVLGKIPRGDYRPALEQLKADYQAAGLTIAGVESHPVQIRQKQTVFQNNSLAFIPDLPRCCRARDPRRRRGVGGRAHGA
jgi:hypothetical protein